MVFLCSLTSWPDVMLLKFKGFCSKLLFITTNPLHKNLTKNQIIKFSVQLSHSYICLSTLKLLYAGKHFLLTKGVTRHRFRECKGIIFFSLEKSLVPWIEVPWTLELGPNVLPVFNLGSDLECSLIQGDPHLSKGGGFGTCSVQCGLIWLLLLMFFLRLQISLVFLSCS